MSADLPRGCGGVWFSAVQCHGAADYTSGSVKSAAGYALNYGGKVVRFVVDAHGHRITEAACDPHTAVAVWGVHEGAEA